MSPTPPDAAESVVAVLRRTGAWRLLAIILVQITGALLMLPVIPNLVTNDFASRRAGQPLRCEEFSPTEAPPACQDAHSDVVMWSTWSGFFQNTIFSVILTPALGAWSDVHGRKPFLMIAQTLALVPYALLLANLRTGLPLTWLYVTQAFTGAVTSLAPSLAYIADVVPPTLRAPCFGLILASFSIAILIGPPLGALLAPTIAPLVTMGVIVACIAATFFLLPESLSPAAAAEAAERQAHGEGGAGAAAANAFSATWRALAILRRSPLFIRLTAVLMAGAVVSEGLQDILIQFLQIKLNFVAVDVAHIFMTFGAGALLVQAALLRPLLRTLGERRLLVLGLLAGMGQQIALALASKKAQALGAVCLGSLGSVTFPVISSMKANAALAHEQGSVQGALAGAKAFASGVGPLAFAGLFAAFTRSDSPLPFYPGAPFVLGALVLAGTAILAAGLPVGDPGVEEERVYVVESGPDGGSVDEEVRWAEEAGSGERTELLRMQN